MFEKIDDFLGGRFFQPYANRKWNEKGRCGRELAVRAEIQGGVIYIVVFSLMALMANFIFAIFVFFSFSRVVKYAKFLKENNSEQIAKKHSEIPEIIQKAGRAQRMISLFVFFVILGIAIYIEHVLFLLLSVGAFFFVCSAYFMACLTPGDKKTKETIKLK